VGDKKRIQSELIRSELMFRSIAQHLNYAIIIKDFVTGKTEMNEACGKLFACPVENLRSQSIESYFHKDDRDRITASLKNIVDNNTDSFESECRIINEEGRTINALLSANIIRDEDGKNLFGFITLADITRIKMHVLDLAESEQRYRSLFHENKAAMLLLDQETGDIMDANRAACKLYGFTPDAAKKLNYRDIVFISADETEPGNNAKMNSGDSSFISEHRFMNGQMADVEVFTGEIVVNGKNYIYWIIFNITVRIKALKDLKLLWSAIENLADGVMITESDGTIEYVNPAYLALMGYCKEEVIGKNPRIFKSGKHPVEFYENIFSHIGSGKTWQGKIVNKKKDGSLVEERMVISPVVNEKDKIQHYITVKRDITIEVQLEKELRQAEKMQAIGTLASGIAHDFNNILQIIQIYSELLILGSGADDLMSLNAKEVNNAVLRGKELVNTILTYARQTDIELKVQPFKQLIRESLAFIRAILPSEVSISEHLYEVGQVLCDATSIQQILMNLINNAAYAMDFKGLLNISLTRADNPVLKGETYYGEWAILKITDNGSGMSEETQSRVFEPFFTTKKVGEGTGLGLSTVLGIIENHNGFIDFKSLPGQGTTFTVILPVLKRDNE